MRRRAVLLGAIAVLALGGSAAPEPWTVVRDASTIDMSVRAFGGSHRGRFDEWRGDIVFDPDPDPFPAIVDFRLPLRHSQAITHIQTGLHGEHHAGLKRNGLLT